METERDIVCLRMIQPGYRLDIFVSEKLRAIPVILAGASGMNLGFWIWGNLPDLTG